MGATALVSGGKDSVFSAYIAECQGIPIDELLVIAPSDPDSMLFHTPNLWLVELQAMAWGKRLRRVEVAGEGEPAESAALRVALRDGSEWVTAGAIASSYQWARLHRACFDLGRRLFTPLWGKDAAVVVRAELEAGLDVRFVHVAAEGLSADLLGRRLDPPQLDALLQLGNRGPAAHPAGEGGEFETLVVGAPFFSGSISLDRTEREQRGSATTLRVWEAHLEPKHGRHLGPSTSETGV